jgi:hypothetical protein
LKSLLQASSQIHKDGYLNGKERDIKRKAKKEETKPKVSAQSEPNKRMSTML